MRHTPSRQVFLRLRGHAAIERALHDAKGRLVSHSQAAARGAVARKAHSLEKTWRIWISPLPSTPM